LNFQHKCLRPPARVLTPNRDYWFSLSLIAYRLSLIAYCLLLIADCSDHRCNHDHNTANTSTSNAIAAIFSRFFAAATASGVVPPRDLSKSSFTLSMLAEHEDCL
jgi:hypothetical protein